jgi:hypothetical protein
MKYGVIFAIAKNQKQGNYRTTGDWTNEMNSCSGMLQ